jgi:hypothetical protein
MYREFLGLLSALNANRFAQQEAAMDAVNVHSIAELASKINGLMKWARESGRDDLSTFRGLERRTGVPYSTLQSSLRNGRISSTNENVIAKAYGFRVEWHEWRDTAEIFLEKFRTTRAERCSLTIEARQTTSYLDRQTADFAFGVAGSFDARSEESGIRLVISLSFDQRGWPVFHDLTVGLKEVDLQLFCNRDGTEFELLAITCNSESEGNFRSEVMGTGKGHAYWTINVAESTNSNFLAGARRRNDGQDCICKGFTEGDEIRAVMTARKIQCFGTIAGKSLDTCSQIKKRFIDYLTKREVLKENEATLCEQILMVVEKP